MRVAPELRHEHLRRERPDDRRHDLGEGREPGPVAHPRLERDVDRGALGVARAAFVDGPRPREQRFARLVDRDGEHPRVPVEDRLDAVAVVDVDVHVRDRVHAVVEQPRDRDRGIVVHAEPGGPRRHRVMQASGGVEGVQDRAVADGLGRDERGTRHERTRLVHVREDRVVAGPEPEPAPAPLLAVPGRLRRLDVRVLVHEPELGVGRGAAREPGDVRALEQAARLDQRPRVEHPLGPERMLGSVVVAAHLGTQDETGGAAHAVRRVAIAAAVRSTISSHSSSVITNGGPSITRSPSPST